MVSAMSYVPTKEHLDAQIPQFYQQVNALIRSFQAETGADDAAVAALLARLSKKYQAQVVVQDGFGFR